MTPPSEQPPLDDEDHDNLEEGSGQPPQVDDFYKILHNSKGTGLHEAERENKNNQREKEMHHPTSSTFCSPPCWKSCPTGFKVDEVRGCQKCKCRKCPSMRGCQQQCPGGLEQDHHGCRTCHCQSPKLSIFTSAHDDFTVDEVSGNGVYTTAQTNPPCNTTHMAAKVETNQDQRHDGQNRSRVFLDHIPITHSHNHVPTSDGLSLRGGTSVGASDGMTKSAVQTSPVEWSQLCLIIVPLVLVFLLVAALTFHYCRRYHRDKYYISDYRATETEKLRPVKTADDHLHVRHV
ncbi:uncharacterized protein [Panulirus ornatus]|uniref:uncharacterized protein isoform X4 n=1 Tax=Panulirus ornatus TaxID=150431 RepID=UPI003A83F214